MQATLYKRVCPSVHRSIGPLVRYAFVKIAENGVMQNGDASYVVYTALFQKALREIFFYGRIPFSTALDLYKPLRNPELYHW